MSFVYRIVLPSWAQEVLYQYMAEHGLPSAKVAAKQLLLEAARDETLVQRALRLLEQIERMEKGTG